jgi:hypothetical protein
MEWETKYSTVLKQFWNGSETEKSILNGLGKDKPYFWQNVCLIS